MNEKRHMKQAKRLDNGELAIGYLAKSRPYLDKPDCIVVDGEWFENDLGLVAEHREQIDPDTVEDVAVKPIRVKWEFAQRDGQYRHFCPNCEPECRVVKDENKLEHCLNVFGQPNYCPWCGQRIDWSGEGEVSHV